MSKAKTKTAPELDPKSEKFDFDAFREDQSKKVRAAVRYARKNLTWNVKKQVWVSRESA